MLAIYPHHKVASDMCGKNYTLDSQALTGYLIHEISMHFNRHHAAAIPGDNGGLAIVTFEKLIG